MNLVKLLLVSVLPLAGLVGALSWKTRVQTYSDDVVVAGEIRRPIHILSVHSSPAHYIRLGGKTYDNVRGGKPYYLKVPELKSIFFVTETARGALFHLLNLADQSELLIHGARSDLGNCITFLRPPGSDLTDYILEATPTRLSVAERNANRTTVYVLNLQSQAVDRVDEILCDERGQVTNRTTHPLIDIGGGKP